jgi:hypothetical protein
LALIVAADATVLSLSLLAVPGIIFSSQPPNDSH